MERVSMQDLYRSDGQINFFGWLLFFGTLLALGYAIYQSHCNIKKMKSDESMLQIEIAGLKKENEFMRKDLERIKSILNIS